MAKPLHCKPTDVDALIAGMMLLLVDFTFGQTQFTFDPNGNLLTESSAIVMSTLSRYRAP